MRYSDLPQLEKTFLETGNDGEYILKKFSIPIPGENGNLEGYSCKPANRTNYFFNQDEPKERILLHFTAGNIKSDMGALTQQDFHVSVPFVIGRSGAIYQLFSAKNWSGNIGKTPLNPGNSEDKRTIAIEISNYAFLTAKDGNLETIYSRVKEANGSTSPADVYCSLQETDAYQKISTPFRGQPYFATFTPEQYQSLIVLLRYLTSTFNIPKRFLPEPKRYTYTPDVLTFKGIVSHVNYREFGKWDIGPAFDWEQVIDGVQAASFTPSASRAAEGVAPEIFSENDLHSELPEGDNNPPGNDTFNDIDDIIMTKEGYTPEPPAADAQALHQYVTSLELQQPRAAYKDIHTRAAVEADTVDADKDQSFLADKSLVSFVSGVSAQNRTDILNATLLAQLAANKKQPIDQDVTAWYNDFINVLGNIGWNIEAADITKYEAKQNLVEVESVIIDIITKAFGANFVSIVTSTLNAMKGLTGKDDKKLIAFEKNTHTQSKGCFQIALANEENGAVSMQLGTFLLTSTNEIKQILFVRLTKDTTSFECQTRRCTLNTDVYGAIRESVRAKLQQDTINFVAAIDI